MVVLVLKVYFHQIFFILFCKWLNSAYDVILKNRLVLLPEAIVCEKTLHAHAVSCIAGGPWPTLLLGLAGPSVLPRAHHRHRLVKRGQPDLLWGGHGEHLAGVRRRVNPIVHHAGHLLLVVLVQRVDVQQRVGRVAAQCRGRLWLDLVQSHTGGSSSGGYMVVVTRDKSRSSRHSSARLRWVQDLFCRMRGVYKRTNHTDKGQVVFHHSSPSARSAPNQ